MVISDKDNGLVRDVTEELREFFSRDPLFALYGVPDEYGNYPSDYHQD